MLHAVQRKPGEAASRRRAWAAARPAPPRSGAALQRKGASCACGGGCPACKEELSLQPKLRISATDDAFEREADAVADHVLAGPGAAPPAIQRLSAAPASAPSSEDEGEAEVELQEEPLHAAAPPAASGDEPLLGPRIDALRGRGQPLPQTLRARFEPRFGRDFADVRLHSDAAAAALARAVDARAFTVGSDIVFGAGELAPESPGGLRLLAHELTHTVQQGEAGRAAPAQRSAAPGAYSLRLQGPGGEQWIGPPKLQLDEAEAAPALIQRKAVFAKPTPVARNPLPRVLAGDTPGLTLPTINGNVVASAQDVARELGTFSVSHSTFAGVTSCKVDPGNTVTTSANVIVSTAAGAAGWQGKVSPAALGGGARCAQADIPITMTASPSNADFVRRVADSEQEHVTDLNTLHARHIVPFDKTVGGLSNVGGSPQDCVKNLQPLLAAPVSQAAFGLVLGWQASVNTLDGPGGMHQDTGTLNLAADCSSATLSVAESNVAIPGAAPGNVRPVAPTTSHFSPTLLSAKGSDLVVAHYGPPAPGQPWPTTVLRSFASNANATRALQIIQHYGMSSRNLIGPMEYYLVSGKAPSGALAGASELAIDPAFVQVSVDVPNAGDWAITQVVGNHVNVLINFAARRDEAYSAVAELRRLRFTAMGWVGASRQSPDMLYFRT